MILSRFTRPITQALGLGFTPVRTESSPREIYELMEAYYLSNGLYSDRQITSKAENLWAPVVREVMNPVQAAIEVYPKLLWPGTLPNALPLVTDNDRIIEPIHQIWKWSNWSAKKQVMARFLPLHGDVFIRIHTKPDMTGKPVAVYMRLVNAKYVTSFDVDERGIVTYLRYDVGLPRTKGMAKFYTEVWDLVSGFRCWTHTKGINASLSSIGDPDETKSLADLNIDFIPWVHAPFIDASEIGTPEKRGLPLIWTALTKIDNLNLKATTLDSQMFRNGRPTWMLLSNMTDKDGRPMPAPKIGASSTVELNGETVYHFPGMSKFESLIPNIPWQWHLANIEATLESLKNDLPELRYYDVSKEGDVSGRALRYKLGPAIDRLKEARGNGESAMIRAHQMALTVGSKASLFRDIGSYEKGDFDHSIRERNIIPEDDVDRADRAVRLRQAGLPVATIMREVFKWTDEQINLLEVDMGTESSIVASTQTGVAQ